MKQEFNLSGASLGFVMSSAQIGCIFGAMLGGTICDLFGRKKALFFSSVLFGLSTIFTAFAPSIGVFNVFRIIGGLGVGLASIVSPMYIAEIAPSSIRGRLVTLNQFAICIGLLSAVIVSYFMSFHLGWRWMFASQSIPILFFIGGLFVIPESPRWLVKKNRNKEAFLVLKRINGETVAHSEMEEIEGISKVRIRKILRIISEGDQACFDYCRLPCLFSAVERRYANASVRPADFFKKLDLPLHQMQFSSQLCWLVG